ncbi:2-dehydropantoate 2-reductase [Allobranchiibius sp. CTAmp26]|uniref:2-dehydropantoate 2-reductase n=1 Tax=Allobranchiibius sp. CTAmp26 TaxID=2815214 RepID=UPI001AA16269|nr:2-dehydropantoate 2-reductase [Allobranchiibius sp. CTAmp26]MBO1756125.1 2-dehydropantoate 2-reductase [Allobranchiibius sp. CTAmp26]
MVGAGAIGGTLAAAFARGGAQVCLLARGVTLAALARDGLVLEHGGATERYPLPVSADPAALGPQDVLVLAVKAPSLPSVVPTVTAMLGDRTRVVTAMNGLPWWFLAGGFGGPASGRTLRAVDAGGALARALPSERVIGSVVHLGASTPAPGVVRWETGDGVVLGDPAGGADEVTQGVAAVLGRGGLAASTSEQIQRDVWWKLWGNMTMNPVSLLTTGTMDTILDDELVMELVDAVMLEAKTLGGALGVPMDQDPADRHRITRRLGAFRTSMLQDLDAGRPVELDALLGAVIELGELAQVPLPTARMLFGLARSRARAAGLYPAPSTISAVRGVLAD